MLYNQKRMNSLKRKLFEDATPEYGPAVDNVAEIEVVDNADMDYAEDEVDSDIESSDDLENASHEELVQLVKDLKARVEALEAHEVEEEESEKEESEEEESDYEEDMEDSEDETFNDDEDYEIEIDED